MQKKQVFVIEVENVILTPGLLMEVLKQAFQVRQWVPEVYAVECIDGIDALKNPRGLSETFK